MYERRASRSSMGSWVNIIGILSTTIGTVLSLWSILFTKSEYMGTCQQYANINDDFKKQKKWVIFGTALIILGSSLQIISVLI